MNRSPENSNGFEMTYRKTSALGSKSYRGQKDLVVKVLLEARGPLSAAEILREANKRGAYIRTLKGGPKGFVMTRFCGGGEKGLVGSVRFHLRALKGLGMVEEVASSVRGQVVRWGNSHAVRIPKPILDQARIREGDEVRIRAEGGRIALEPVNAGFTLESLVAAITPENRHEEQDWGKPVGRELW